MQNFNKWCEILCNYRTQDYEDFQQIKLKLKQY